MKRGEVWIGNLNPNRGTEIGKIRPVLVIQDNRLTLAGSPTIVVLPMTTQIDLRSKRSKILILARDKLRDDCQILVAQPRTLDRRRFGSGPLTILSGEEFAAVEKSLAAVLGMNY